MLTNMDTPADFDYSILDEDETDRAYELLSMPDLAPDGSPLPVTYKDKQVAMRLALAATRKEGQL